MKIVFLLAALLFCQAYLCAQNLLFKGRIGNRPIVMQLDTSYETVSGEYCYWDRKKLVFIDGSKDRSGSITLADSRETQTFQLAARGKGYTGTLTEGGRKIKVELKPASLSEYANPYGAFKFVGDWKKESPINYAVASGYVFQRTGTDTLGGHLVERLREKYTKVLTVRIAGEQTAATVRINNKLMEVAIEAAMNASECGEYGDDAFDMDINKLYINSSVLSVSFYSTVYCGGAHPGEISDAYNFDRSTGKMLRLEDVLWLGKGNPPAQGSEDWYKYRDSVLAPWLFRTFSRLYPPQVSGYDTGCAYDNADAWQEFKWCFTKKGLYIGPQFAHVAAACNDPEWSVIPYAIVRKYKNPKCRLDF